MLSTPHTNSNPHRLSFLRERKTATMMFNLEEEIYLVERWANIVYVHAKA